MLFSHHLNDQYRRPGAILRGGGMGTRRAGCARYDHGAVIRGLKIHRKNLETLINTRKNGIFAVWGNRGFPQKIFY